MKKLSLTFSFLLFLSFSFAQYKHVLIKDTLAYNAPLTILKADGLVTAPTNIYVIDYGHIASHTKTTDSIPVIQLIKGTKLVNINELYSKYHIKDNYHDLPVYIDSVIINKNKPAYFQLSVILSVKVKKEKDTESKYISISTIHHSNNPYADIYIKGAYTIPAAKN